VRGVAMANANAGTFFAHLKTFGVRLEESTRALRDALNTSTTADLAAHPAVSSEQLVPLVIPQYAPQFRSYRTTDCNNTCTASKFAKVTVCAFFTAHRFSSLANHSSDIRARNLSQFLYCTI
jgi:hypothetical protein